MYFINFPTNFVEFKNMKMSQKIILFVIILFVVGVVTKSITVSGFGVVSPSTAHPVKSTVHPVKSTAHPVKSTAHPVKSTVQPVKSINLTPVVAPFNIKNIQTTYQSKIDTIKKIPKKLEQEKAIQGFLTDLGTLQTTNIGTLKNDLGHVAPGESGSNVMMNYDQLQDLTKDFLSQISTLIEVNSRRQVESPPPPYTPKQLDEYNYQQEQIEKAAAIKAKKDADAKAAAAAKAAADAKAAKAAADAKAGKAGNAFGNAFENAFSKLSTDCVIM